MDERPRTHVGSDEPETPPGELTVQEAGRRGGEKVRDTYGREYYQRLGQTGGRKTMETYGLDHYTELGRKGGTMTAKRHGHAHYREIGSRGGQRVKALLAAGKRLEEGGRK